MEKQNVWNKKHYARFSQGILFSQILKMPSHIKKYQKKKKITSLFSDLHLFCFGLTAPFHLGDLSVLQDGVLSQPKDGNTDHGRNVSIQLTSWHWSV